MKPIEPTPTTEEAEVTTPERRCRLDKAGPSLKAVVAWLLERTPREKLCAVTLSNLILGEVQQNLYNAGRYEGNIGEDLLRDWREDIEAMTTDAEPIKNDATMAQFALDCEDLLG
ncbi:MAG: hypothetical protein QM570_18330 [Planctomycetota bacterium]|nr:hypothetical protein [Planctomycetota bacterium]